MSNRNSLFTGHGGYVIFLIVVVSLLSFLIALFTPYSNDDYAYLGYFSGANQMFDSILDYPRACYSHWLNLNGRIINYVCILFTFIPRWVLAILFGLTTCWMLVMMIKMMGFRTQSELGPVAVMAFCVICLPWWNNMGSFAYFMNYVWVTPFVFWFIRFMRPECHLTWFATILLVPVGIIAGSLHEAMTFSLLCGFIAYFIMTDYWRKISPKLWVLLVSFALGVGMILSSPGAWNRLVNPYMDLHMPVLLNVLISDPLALAVIIYILCAATLRSGRREILRLSKTPMVVFVVAMVVAFIFSAATGIVGRGGWYAEIFALIVLCRWLNEKRAVLNHNCSGVLIALLSVAMVGYLAVETYWQVKFSNEFNMMAERFDKSPDGVIFMNYSHENAALPGRSIGVYEPIRYENKKLFADYKSKTPKYPVILPVSAKNLDFKKTEKVRFADGTLLLTELPPTVEKFGNWVDVNIVDYDGKKWVAEGFTRDGRKFYYLTPHCYMRMN